MGNQIFSYVYIIVSIYAWVFWDFFLMSYLLSSKKYSFLFSFFGAQLHYVACANITILAKSCSWHAAYSAEETTWLQAFLKNILLINRFLPCTLKFLLEELYWSPSAFFT